MALSETIADMVSSFDFLVFGLIFLLYIAVNSQIFYDRVLGSFSGTMSMGIPTNYGTMIQAAVVATVSMIIYGLYENEII
jgi:hypothetical protein